MKKKAKNIQERAEEYICKICGQGEETLKHLIKDNEEELIMDGHGRVRTKKEMVEKIIENRKKLRIRRKQIFLSILFVIHLIIKKGIQISAKDFS